jgi:signal transduction histidine kinase
MAFLDNPTKLVKPYSSERIKRAARYMQSTTETLLWLSREDAHLADKISERVSVDVDRMLGNLVEDNRYLLGDKPVCVELDLEPGLICVAEAPFRIALNNLIRNAFQYTEEGEVLISSRLGTITITNRSRAAVGTDHSDADYGYGLGLRLVDRIVKIMGWTYEHREIQGGRRVSLKC